MFTLFAKSSRPEWYPGQRVVRDRWGSPVGATIGAREFRPVADSTEDTLNTMRWGLGLM